MAHPIAAHEYVSIETVRKNGSRAATPIWIAPLGDQVVMVTNADTWKVKRLRNNPALRLAECNANGKKILGDWVEGTAVILEGEAIKAGTRAIGKKYGWKMWPFALIGKLTREERVVILATLD